MVESKLKFPDKATSSSNPAQQKKSVYVFVGQVLTDPIVILCHIPMLKRVKLRECCWSRYLCAMGYQSRCIFIRVSRMLTPEPPLAIVSWWASAIYILLLAISPDLQLAFGRGPYCFCAVCTCHPCGPKHRSLPASRQNLPRRPRQIHRIILMGEEVRRKGCSCVHTFGLQKSGRQATWRRVRVLFVSPLPQLLTADLGGHNLRKTMRSVYASG